MRMYALRSHLDAALIVLSALATLPYAGARAAEPNYPANEDLRHVRGMLAPHLSPGGMQVLVQIHDATADGGRGHLWLVDIAANRARQLTWSPENDKRGERDGKWLGDGSVLFFARRGERTQLFRLPMAGGEARAYDLKVTPPVDASEQPDVVPPKKEDTKLGPVEAQPIEPEAYEPAPDARWIAIIAPDPETPGEKKQKDSKADALRVDHDLHAKRLYLLDPDSDNLRAVGVQADVEAVIWSKQADQFIVLVEAPNNAADLGPATTVWLVHVNDLAHPVQLKELPPTISSASWSEDGSRLYFLADSARDAPPGYLDLYEMTLSDRSIRDLSADLPGSISRERPISLGPDVFQSVQQGFLRRYVRWHDGKATTVSFGTSVVSGLDDDAKHQGWVWLGQSAGQPTALYYARRPGEAARLLSTPDLLPAMWPIATTHHLQWSSDGLSIEGMLYMPAAAKEKMPLVVDVHGGPTGAFQDAFDPLMTYLLGQGWAVLRTNPRGSTGYGAAFAAANKNDLGGGDYRDIIAGVDAALAQYPLDPEKLALMGYSYGGEMAGFVEGKTERFRAIISGAPVIDQHSEYGTEDGSWYDRWFYGKPWEHPEAAWRQSPLAGVASAKTPFMLLQGESDTVDPLGQSQEMYRALRQEGVRVELIRYPREDHGPLAQGMHGLPSPEPWHGFDARQRLVQFIKDAFDQVQ
jgi:dipeptidyl aminopeptidase/acylaminoacyl peptidase